MFEKVSGVKDRAPSYDVKGVDIKEFSSMPSLDHKSVAAIDRLVIVHDWFEDQRGKVKVMFPKDAVGSVFWDWVLKEALCLHGLFLKKNPVDQVTFMIEYDVPSSFVGISERVSPLVFGAFGCFQAPLLGLVDAHTVGFVLGRALDSNMLTVTGSPSYSELYGLPQEACNSKQDEQSKFGG